MNSNQSRNQAWIILLGIVFGVSLVISVSNILRSQRVVDDRTVKDLSELSLQTLQEQKVALLKRLEVLDQFIKLKNARGNNFSHIFERNESSLNSQPNSEVVPIQLQPVVKSKELLVETKLKLRRSEVEPVKQQSIVKIQELPVQTKPFCKYSFKVFVYPIPKTLGAVRIGEEARRNGTLHICRKCILEQFSLEYIILDYFEKFCGRTYNPEEADYFYLPLVRDAEYRYAMQVGGIRSRAPSLAEQALIQLLEKNNSRVWKQAFEYTDYYWHRRHGADHIIVMPAPVTNLRHESSRRGFFHYMIQLKAPIFLALEYSKSFVEEYPICSTQKNILVPYPTTDPHLYNGKLMNFQIERKYLLYYAGGLHGDCIETRMAMRDLMFNATKFAMVIPPVRRNMNEREHGFLGAKFCPIPVGDSPSSKRMYDVLNFGCIPVVLSDDLIWAFTDQTGGLLNHSTFSIQLPQSVVQYHHSHSIKRYESNRSAFGFLPLTGVSLFQILLESIKNDPDYENGLYINPLVRILRRIPQADIEYLQRNGVEAAKHYRFYQMNQTMQAIPTSHHYFPDGGAMDMIAEELVERKTQGIETIHGACKEELGKTHRYVHRFPCEADKKDSLLKRKRRRRK